MFFMVIMKEIYCVGYFSKNFSEASSSFYKQQCCIHDTATYYYQEVHISTASLVHGG